MKYFSLEYEHCDAFDYWGQGTKVTVSSQAAAAPDLFPLVQCNSGTTGTVTVGCIAQNFFPETLTFQWTDASGTTQTFKQYPMIMKGDRYTGVSVLDVSKSVWDSRRSFSCSVTHPEGSRSVTLQKSIPPPPPKATLVTVPAGDTQTSLAPITVTLTQSSPKEIFSNNQAKFECVITGPDQSIINDFQIIWQVDGQNVTDRIETKPGIKKISTMTRAHTDWQSINKVSCSAIRDNMTPVTQELTIQKGDGSDPKVTVHIPTWEDSDKSAQGSEVTLVCLVSSRAQQDYYIAWREDTEQNAGTYSDGINFPRQKTQNGYSVTSIYITTKDKWEKNKFICNVWPAGRNKSMRSRDVSYALSNSVEYCNSALSCTDGVVAEDEYSSLWSTTSSFIFLFICSLLYSTIISLVKIK